MGLFLLLFLPFSPDLGLKENDFHHLGNQTFPSFREAKKKLESLFPSGTTLYCNCQYRGKKIVGECSLRSSKNRKVLRKREWEHIVPLSVFTLSMKDCTSRKDCTKNSPEFNRMAGDLYNLAPAVGAANRLRSNLPIGDIPGEARHFGTCDFEASKAVFEPREEVKGDVARTYLYMDTAYPGRKVVNPENAALLMAWDAGDPVDGPECQRYSVIREAMGADNPVLKVRCLALTNQLLSRSR